MKKAYIDLIKKVMVPIPGRRAGIPSQSKIT
jgi:hypothetical protein